MLQNQRVPDKDILKQVTQRLARTGLASQTPITAAVRNGNVSLSGIIHFDYQRKAALKAVQGIHGVQHVVDQLRVQPATAKWHSAHGGDHLAGPHPAVAHPTDGQHAPVEGEPHPNQPDTPDATQT